MSVNPLYDKTTPDKSRGLTASVWRQSLQAYCANNPEFGVRIKDDFETPVVANTSDASAVSNWFIQDAAAGGTSESLISTSHPNGYRTLSAATGTAHFGIEAHYGTTSTSLGTVFTPFYGGSSATAAQQALRPNRVVYETRVDLGTLGTFFIGLTEPIVEFLSSTSTLPANSDFIGFYRLTDGALTFEIFNDNNGGTAVSDSITLLTSTEMAALESATADTNIVKLAFAINKQPWGISFDVAVNGVWYGSLAKTLDPLACPIEALTPKYAIGRGGSSDTTVALPIDSIDVFMETIS